MCRLWAPGAGLFRRCYRKRAASRHQRQKKGTMKTRLILTVAATAAYMTTWAAGEPKPIKVLTVTGDWKSQEWYQDEWMAKPGQPSHKLYRGRYIAAAVEKAAPGQFEFTDITNYAGQEYLDANYLAQFDVVLMGDIMGWSLNPRFHEAVEA